MVGRLEEQDKLKRIAQGSISELVVVYGRRRVGKTFLIRESFANKFTFYVTGLANATMKEQLINFHGAMRKMHGGENPVPQHWLMAFQQLTELLEKDQSPRKILFMDELPWLDSSKSKFLSAFEHFWNHWASARRDIVLIVCGSAASWMTTKLLKNKGGLHNRVTDKIKLEPFTLKECEQFLVEKNFILTRYQIAELYMVFGGIPYYWNALKKELSATQNISKICFAENGLLRDEFENLYASLFKNSEGHVALVKSLGKKMMGMTRDELIKTSKLPNSGNTTRLLEDLESSGFIRKYVPFNKKSKLSLYQLTDLFSLFHLRFMQGETLDANFWATAYDSPGHRAWSGYAFEMLCLLHLDQIKKKLGISGIHTTAGSWRSRESAQGAQIDLVIDRKDATINLCEIKFSINPFAIDKTYSLNLRNKLAAFKSETKTRKAVMLTFISSFGLVDNEYAKELPQQSISIDHLFD